MKSKIKLFLCAAGFLMLSNHVDAQSSITIDASQNITNFKFVNSAGEQDMNYSVNYSGGYSLGYRYTLENGMFFPVKIGMRTAGATYVYDDANYSWNLQYGEARLGLGYNYAFGKFGAHISATGYFGYLLKANQRLNNEDFDIRASDQINTIDYGVIVSPGVNFTASDYINIYLDLNYMMGLANLETDDTQTSNNTMYGANLGLAFTIK
ncbi:MAG: PorT family protein, partial [Crocinitomicaceae bacterium]|nr:PorT family protein [Crocinitomicaceae bacterium]